MFKKYFALSLLFVAFSISHAYSSEEYYPGKINLVNGRQLRVLTQIPSSSKDQSIKYKSNEHTAYITLKAEEIISINVQPTDSTNYKFYYATCVVYNRKDNSHKKKNKKLWLYLDFETKHINVYSTSESFTINKKGKVDLYTTYKFDFYVKKNTAENYLLVYRYEGQGKKEKYFRACLSDYCKDIPPLAKDIAKGVYPWDRLYEIAAVYNWHKEKEK